MYIIISAVILAGAFGFVYWALSFDDEAEPGAEEADGPFPNKL